MSNHIRRAAVAAMTCAAFAPPIVAQRSSLTAADLGQIVAVVFDSLTSPEQAFSRVPVAKRKIFFDHERTVSLFERFGVPHTEFAQLHFRTPVQVGTRALLDDCQQAAPKPCAKLGWSVYSFIEPISASDSQVVVQAYFLWPDRGMAEFREGVPPVGRAFLVGFDREVYFVRGKDQALRFSKFGITNVGE
jgi:hypothetical protein